MRSEEGSSGGERRATSAGVIRADGLVRVDDDARSDLRVKLLVVDSRLSLMTQAMELGNWALSSVGIVQVDDDRFDLVIDGETLEFFPDAAAHFASLGIVSSGKRKKRRSRRRSPRRSTEDEAAPPETTVTAAETDSGPETNVPEVEAEVRSAREERAAKKAERRAVKTARAEAREAAAEEKAAQRRAKQAEQEERRAAKAAREEERAATRAERAVARQERKTARAGRPHPVRDRIAAAAVSLRKRAAAQTRKMLIRAGWRARLGMYWAMDEMRQIDGFPFNRIPIVDDEKKREPGHVHSFRAITAPAGIIREVCECGKIRIESRPIQLEGPAHLRNRTTEPRKGSSEGTGV